jgi:hypothetical protein
MSWLSKILTLIVYHWSTINYVLNHKVFLIPHIMRWKRELFLTKQYALAWILLDLKKKLDFESLIISYWRNEIYILIVGHCRFPLFH